MEYSTEQDWVNGPGDLKEEDVEDVPTPGRKVRVRGLPARFSAQVQSQMRVITEGRDQVATIDVAAMERLQFQHGVVKPQLSDQAVEHIQENYGPAFRKVIEVVDRLSGIDKEAISKTEQRFPAGGEGPNGRGRGELGAETPAPSGVGG